MAQEQMEADITAHVSWTKQSSKHAGENGVSGNADDLSAAQSNDEDQRNPCMQALWEKTSSKELEVPYKYQSVSVLIVHWASYLDEDLKCEQESKELHDLFQNKFNFKSRILKLDSDRDPQLQLRYGLIGLVLDHDGPCRSNLLLVYYSGHGMYMVNEGLYIKGVEQHDPEKPSRHPYPPHVKWKEAEKELENTSADILMIVDACYAGSLFKDGVQEDRSWEVLAASAADELTPIPGPESYTRALIDCLKDRIENQPDELFTICQLHHDMQKQRNTDKFVYRPRHGVNNRYIKLARLDATPASTVPSSCTKESASLTLRFSFRDKTFLAEDEVEKMAKLISEGASKSDLGINKIDWVEFKQRDPSPMIRFRRLCVAVKNAQRLWRGRAARDRLKREREEDGQEQMLSPKRVRIGDSSYLQTDRFGRLSPSPSDQSGRESPGIVSLQGNAEP